jgi:uncharacterized lipoprotein
VSKSGLSFGLCVVVASLLSGCGFFRASSESCRDDALYAGAREEAPLRIPPGLQAPDTRNALKVPDLNVPEAPRAAGAGCLDAPPPYSTPKPVEPEA